jgi:hypothetical protein
MGYFLLDPLLITLLPPPLSPLDYSLPSVFTLGCRIFVRVHAVFRFVVPMVLFYHFVVSRVRVANSVF